MSSVSARSQRIKQQARHRAHKIWLQDGKFEQLRYVDGPPQANVLSGGSKLAGYVSEADAHLVAMRKIVH